MLWALHLSSLSILCKHALCIKSVSGCALSGSSRSADNQVSTASSCEYRIGQNWSETYGWCMQDTRSLDGKASLLSYIAHQLSTGHPPAALLAQEVPHVVGPALKTSVQVGHICPLQ